MLVPSFQILVSSCLFLLILTSLPKTKKNILRYSFFIL
nr:MAG TPA: hypothetical protein [Caudoviricetes sp.]